MRSSKLHRKLLSGLTAAALTLSLSLTAAATVGTQNIQVNYSGIKVMLDGSYLTLADANGTAVEPFAYNGTTYLPVRAVANALGLNVQWLPAESTVALSSGGTRQGATSAAPEGHTAAADIQVSYSDIKVTLDGNLLTLTDATGAAVEPFAYNGTTYLPVRAVSNALGVAVNWNASTNTVELGAAPTAPTAPPSNSGSSKTAQNVTFYVQGMLNEFYLGAYTQEWLEFMGITETEAKQSHQENLSIEADFFAGYFQIVNLTDALRARLTGLYEKVYSQAKFTVQTAVAQADGSYAVEVLINPIDVIEQLETGLEAYMQPFFDKYASVDVNAMTDEEYDAYDLEWATMIIDRFESLIPQLGYKAQTSVVLHVSKDSTNTWRINTPDSQLVDENMIYYPNY